MCARRTLSDNKRECWICASEWTLWGANQDHLRLVPYYVAQVRWLRMKKTTAILSSVNQHNRFVFPLQYYERTIRLRLRVCVCSHINLPELQHVWISSYIYICNCEGSRLLQVCINVFCNWKSASGTTTTLTCLDKTRFTINQVLIKVFSKRCFTLSICGANRKGGVPSFVFINVACSFANVFSNIRQTADVMVQNQLT